MQSFAPRLNPSYKTLDYVTAGESPYTLTPAFDLLWVYPSSADITINLPQASTCVGKTFTIYKEPSANDNRVIITAYAGDSIYGGTTYSLLEDYSSVIITADAYGEWYVLNNSFTIDRVVGWAAGTTGSIDGRAQIYLVETNATSNFTISLPPASENTGRTYIIKKKTSASYSVILDGNGSETIDDSLTYSFSPYNSCVIISCDGYNWSIIGAYGMTSSSVAAWAVVSKTTTYTATTSDEVILCSTSGGNWTLTLPAASGNTGVHYHIKKTTSDANTLTIDGNASETIDGATTVTIVNQYESKTIVCDGAGWNIV